jgi:integration host factor subunit beta
MNKSDLIMHLVSNSYYSNDKEFMTKFVNEVLDLFADTLARGRRIEIRSFGSFCTRKRHAKKVRNPKTNKIYDFPARNVVFFRASTLTRKALISE